MTNGSWVFHVGFSYTVPQNVKERTEKRGSLGYVI
jgi:hypothetical protein